MDPDFGFIIDTDSYAGDFERELCGFITGHYGDCEVGMAMAKLFMKDHTPIDGVTDRIDPESGSCGQATVFDGNDFNSVLIHFYKEPTQKDIDLMKARAYEYAIFRGQRPFEKEIKILGFRLYKLEYAESFKDV
jgi:hypothetical protein